MLEEEEEDTEPPATFLCGFIDNEEALGYVTTLHLFYLVIGFILVLASVHGKLISMNFILISSAAFIGFSGLLSIIGAQHARKFPLAMIPLRVWQISILVLLLYCLIAAIYELALTIPQHFDSIVSNAVVGWFVICCTLIVLTSMQTCSLIITHQYHLYVVKKKSLNNVLEGTLGLSSCQSFQRVIYVRRKERKEEEGEMQQQQQQQQQQMQHAASRKHRSHPKLISEPVEV